MMVKYKIEEPFLVVTEVIFKPLEFFDWSCLTIGALGWGQIQFKNSNHITINQNYSRKNWMIKLCGTLSDFYPKEIGKIEERTKKFKPVKEFWLQKPNL